MKYKKGETCRVRRSVDEFRGNYFMRKYATETPTVVVLGPLPEIYGKGWKPHFLFSPEGAAYLSGPKLPIDETLLYVKVMDGKKKLGTEIVHPTEIRRVAA